MPTVWKQEFCHEIILLSSSHKCEKSSGPSQTDRQNMNLYCNRCRCRCVCSWTDLDNLHGRLAHRRLCMGCDMVAGRGAVQKVPGPPPSFLPVVLTPVTDLLSEPNLPPRSREGPGTLHAVVGARQTLGSAEGQNPPKRKERTVEQVRLN